MSTSDAQPNTLWPATCDTPRFPSNDELAESIIGKAVDRRYVLQSLIGQGGMGAVYKALHLALNKTVALKILWPQLATNANALRRFQQEAKATSGLDHPGLVTVYDYGLTEFGAPYLVMQFVHGDSLAQVLEREGRLSWMRALNASIQICDALSYAHANGVIHRDLKPGNIILNVRRDGSEVVQIVDFGIAKFLSEASNEPSLTVSGEVFGSPLYMSPEQCIADYVDHRSDIYSLACVMYEMFVGQPPFCGEHAMQTMFKQVNEKPTFNSFKDLKIPSGIPLVLQKALAKRKKDRYSCIDDLKYDLLLVREKGLPRLSRMLRWLRHNLDPKRLLLYPLAFLIGTWLGITLALWSEINFILHLPSHNRTIDDGTVQMQQTSKHMSDRSSVFSSGKSSGNPAKGRKSEKSEVVPKRSE